MTTEMQSSGTSAAALRRKRRGRLIKTRRGAALATAFLFVATPAMASVIIQNFMAADITATDACFKKIAGDDATASPLVTFDDTGTITDAAKTDGAQLIEEKITLEGQIGDRVIFTDVVTYQNNCGSNLSIQLLGAEATGFTDTAAQLWLSNVAAPADVDPNLEAPTDDWNDEVLTIPAATADGLVPDVAGPVIVADGATIQGAFVVSTSTTATAASVASLTWIAEATVVP